MLLLNIKGSCLIIEIFFLKDSSVKSFIFIPSINISPEFASNTLVNKLNSVDLPCPDFPTIAIFLLGSNFKLKLFNIISSLGYEKLTFLNSITPLTFFRTLLPNFSSSYNLLPKISLTLDNDTITLWYVCVRPFIFSINYIYLYI